MGILGTAAGLLFVDPTIKSLFDQFIGILGMFLGVLAGLFALGATTKRANGPGSLIGAMVCHHRDDFDRICKQQEPVGPRFSIPLRFGWLRFLQNQ